LFGDGAIFLSLCHLAHDHENDCRSS
jgi:hypothetical protein